MDYQTTINKLLDGVIPINLNPLKRKYWPRFAFHFTDIENAIEILKLGFICSRNYARNHNIMINDNASEKVLNNTNPRVKDMVRLYFRPRTPTQYYNEGFQTKRSRNNSEFSANCPVPIFFLFDLNKLLISSGVKFSDRSLALSENVPLMDTPEEFSKLPFNDIYHDSGLGDMSSERKTEVKHHKHAEIVKRDILHLDYLKWIYVRSVAEKETLINLLHDAGIYKYDKIITVSDETTFYMDRNYIKRVVLGENDIKIDSSVKDPYPKEWGDSQYAVNPENTEDFLEFKLKLTQSNGNTYYWPKSKEKKALLQDRVGFINPQSDYKLEIYIDDHIAYKGAYNVGDDLPF